MHGHLDTCAYNTALVSHDNLLPKAIELMCNMCFFQCSRTNIFYDLSNLFNYVPVDDAMPDRLPHAKLTRTAESCGLLQREYKPQVIS